MFKTLMNIKEVNDVRLTCNNADDETADVSYRLSVHVCDGVNQWTAEAHNAASNDEHGRRGQSLQTDEDDHRQWMVGDDPNEEESGDDQWRDPEVEEPSVDQRYLIHEDRHVARNEQSDA